VDWKRLLLAATVLVAIGSLVLLLANRADPDVEAGGTTSTVTDRSMPPGDPGARSPSTSFVRWTFSSGAMTAEHGRQQHQRIQLPAVTGGSAWSEHSYGLAIGVNPPVNPHVRGSSVLPPEGAAYADHSLDAPGMIHAGDEVVDVFAARGSEWGGCWSSPTDYQHFSTSGH